MMQTAPAARWLFIASRDAKDVMRKLLMQKIYTTKDTKGRFAELKA